MISIVRFLLGVYIWLIGVSMIEFVASGEWFTVAFSVILVLPALWGYRKLGKFREKKTYGESQKEYGIVIVSELIKDPWEMDDEEYEEYNPPFENFVNACVEMGNVSREYQFTKDQWNSRSEYPAVDGETAYMVVTDHPDAKYEMVMRLPLYVSNSPADILRFLEEHRV